MRYFDRDKKCHLAAIVLARQDGDTSFRLVWRCDDYSWLTLSLPVTVGI